AVEPAKEKGKGNGFVRALTAPFRALAKLFGSRKKSDAAKKREEKAQPKQAGVVEAAVVGTAPETVKAPEAAPKPEEAQPSAPAAAPTVAKTAPTAGGARIVRPGENGVVEAAKPKMWVPVIGGIPKDPLSQGRALLQHGYVQEAISELSIAASRPGPEIVEANNLLGLAYDRMGWHLQAIECYKRALSVKPNDAVIIANLGYSLYLAEDRHGALKRLKQAARLSPSTPVIHNNLGIVQARMGRYGDALKSFTRASNEYDAHVKLAGILELERRDRDAAKHYEAALKLQPGTSALLERLVAIYERTGERNKAETARRALGQPQNPQRTATGGGG
ncbi:MAG TPA: tetratricopeptide repeat protein, partial [Pyrinomonadaceae bacterium]|nr:tetratricopeptide repeat protein [Pyrinomonadaceae bacterium]